MFKTLYCQVLMFLSPNNSLIIANYFNWYWKFNSRVFSPCAFLVRLRPLSSTMTFSLQRLGSNKCFLFYLFATTKCYLAIKDRRFFVSCPASRSDCLEGSFCIASKWFVFGHCLLRKSAKNNKWSTCYFYDDQSWLVFEKSKMVFLARFVKSVSQRLDLVASIPRSFICSCPVS